MIDERFVVFGALLNLAGSTSYIISTIKGKTKPNRVSWFLWAAAPLLAFSAEIQHGVGLAALMTFMAGFCPFLIFLASFVNRKSTWRLTRFDVICGLLSVAGLILWYMTGNSTLAIVFGILADGLAGIPTVVKSYKEPDSENWHAFFVGGISAAIALLTIDTWDFAHYGFPIYILSLCMLLVVLIKFRVGKRVKLFARDVIKNEDVRPLP
jgi:hypothetical protein